MSKWDWLVGTAVAIVFCKIAVTYLDSSWGYILGYAVGGTTILIQAFREEKEK